MKPALDGQKEMYSHLYKQKEYLDVNMPDYKITDGRRIKNKKILILGAGTARDIKYLLGDNEVWAVDYSDQSVKFLKTIGIKAYQLDLNKPLSINQTSFDIVVAKDMLEHLDDASNLVKEIYRLLSPSGYAVINVPNHFYLPMRLRLLFGKNIIWKSFFHDHTKSFEEWNYMHKIFFTWKGFKRMLGKNHLKIKKTFFDFGTLNHYSQPEMVFSYLLAKNHGAANRLMVTILKYGWQLFNGVFPRELRSHIVSLSPSLFCASFYVWCSPNNK